MLIEIILINVRIVVTFYIIKKYRTYSESLNIVFVIAEKYNMFFSGLGIEYSDMSLVMESNDS